MAYPTTVLCDANVLYRAPLRDLIIRLSQVGLLRARWTDAIHEEWIRNILKNRPQLSSERLTRTRTQMDEAVRDCLVVGYEVLIDTLSLPDPDDRHVLAAAIVGGCQAIVTFNRQDFPAETLAPLEVEAIHPDDLLMALYDEDADLVCASIRRQRENLRNPPQSAEEMLQTLERQELTKLVARLRERVALL